MSCLIHYRFLVWILSPFRKNSAYCKTWMVIGVWFLLRVNNLGSWYAYRQPGQCTYGKAHTYMLFYSLHQIPLQCIFSVMPLALWDWPECGTDCIFLLLVSTYLPSCCFPLTEPWIVSWETGEVFCYLLCKAPCKLMTLYYDYCDYDDEYVYGYAL